MTGESEAREFSRSVVCAHAQVRVESGVLVEGSAHDVSMNGVLFSSTQCLPVGSSVHVTLLLDGGYGEQRIEAEGHVVRVVTDGVAIEFKHISADSVEYLKRLVLYNADDADKVDSEIQNHVGLKRRG
jgi:hypothetical protein